MEGSNGRNGHVPSLHVGDRVRVLVGLFADWEGIVSEVNESTDRITIEIAVYGRLTPIECERSQLELLPKA